MPELDDIIVLEPITLIPIRMGEPITMAGGGAVSALWTGHGPPVNIAGAQDGDEYLDLDSGDVYQLSGSQ